MQSNLILEYNGSKGGSSSGTAAGGLASQSQTHHEEQHFALLGGRVSGEFGETWRGEEWGMGRTQLSL